MKHHVKYFSDEFKWTVVQEYLHSDLSQLEIMQKYSIKGKACITNWMRKFGLKEGSKSNQFKLSNTMAKGRQKTSEELALEAKVKELERALEYEKLRSLALETMIDVAERNLKITIRTTPGTNQ